MFRTKKPKYGNTKTFHDGKWFMSKLECDHYKNLVLMQKAKVIKDLKCQVRYQLHGLDGRPVTVYIPDFEYFDLVSKKLTVVDTKGVATDVYRIKRKLFESEYKDIIFIELKANQVRMIAKYGK